MITTGSQELLPDPATLLQRLRDARSAITATEAEIVSEATRRREEGERLIRESDELLASLAQQPEPPKAQEKAKPGEVQAAVLLKLNEGFGGEAKDFAVATGYSPASVRDVLISYVKSGLAVTDGRTRRARFSSARASHPTPLQPAGEAVA